MVKIRTSNTNPLQVNFIDAKQFNLAGKIGLTFAPGKKQLDALTGVWDRDLEKDLGDLRNNFKADILVSLLEEHEFAQLQIPTLREEALRFGIEVLWFPICDGGVPESNEDFYKLVKKIATALREGKITVIHCKGGLGRTGLVAAAVLMTTTDLNPEEAIATVRRTRAGAIETERQAEYLVEFHQHLRSFGNGSDESAED